MMEKYDKIVGTIFALKDILTLLYLIFIGTCNYFK